MLQYDVEVTEGPEENSLTAVIRLWYEYIELSFSVLPNGEIELGETSDL